jgi:hypothetical protein
MDQDTTEIIETLNLILAQMATKDDVEALRVEVREGFANIQAELRDIRLRLDALEVLKSLPRTFRASRRKSITSCSASALSRSTLAFTAT